MHSPEGNARPALTVLVVEDEPRVAWILRTILERSGCETTLARSLDDARGALGGASFDVLIVDVILPDGDGLAFARATRCERGVATIVMSGIPDLEASGGLVTLAKPFTTEQLESALCAALRSSRAADAAS